MPDKIDSTKLYDIFHSAGIHVDTDEGRKKLKALLTAATEAKDRHEQYERRMKRAKRHASWILVTIITAALYALFSNLVVTFFSSKAVTGLIMSGIGIATLLYI